MSTTPTYTYEVESGKDFKWTWKTTDRLTPSQARSAIEKTCSDFGIYCLRIWFARGFDPQPEKKYKCENCNHDTHEIFYADNKSWCWVCMVQNLTYCTECGKLELKENISGGMCADCSYVAPEPVVKPVWIRAPKGMGIKCDNCQTIEPGAYKLVEPSGDKKYYCFQCATDEALRIVQPCGKCGNWFDTWELDAEHKMCPTCIDNAVHLGVIY
jgi:hypothetical protein